MSRFPACGDHLIADSPTTAPAGLSLASLPEGKRSILLARAMSDAVMTRPGLYPVVRWGDWFPWLCLSYVIVYCAGRARGLRYFARTPRP